MSKRMSFGVPVAIAGVALVAAGCGSAGTTSAGSSSGSGSAYPLSAPAAASRATAPSGAATVGARHTGLGTVLVDGQGRTLYLFEKDRGMTSACAGACASIWPPLTSAQAVPGAGLAAAKLSVAKQPGGASDVTYAGHPLYTYVGDTKPGDTKGEGLNQFGAQWYVLSPSGKKIDTDGGGNG
jgi:predicted lipoprotein with Yx(FWY)xxD motif